MNLNARVLGIVFCVQMILAASLTASSGIQDNIHVQYVEGNVSGVERLGLENFEILECDARFCQEEMFEEMLDLNPAIICVHAVVTDEMANALYDILKDRYVHFYHVIPQSPLCSDNALFVVSQYSIKGWEFTALEEMCPEQGRFDFVINAGRGFVKHIHTMHADALAHRDVALEAIRLSAESQHSSNNLVVFSETLTLFRVYPRKTALDGYDSFAMITHIKPQRLASHSPRKVRTLPLNSTPVMLCSDNSDDKSAKKSSGSIGYSASGRMDNQGNSSAHAGLDYSRESKSGKQFSVGVGVQAEQRKSGEKNAAVGFEIKGAI